MAKSSSATTPVPIVGTNHDGEKLRTMRRQPTSYFDRGPVAMVEGAASGLDMTFASVEDGDSFDALAKPIDVLVAKL